MILLLSFRHRGCGNGCSWIWRAVRKGHAEILFPLPGGQWTVRLRLPPFHFRKAAGKLWVAVLRSAASLSLCQAWQQSQTFPLLRFYKRFGKSCSLLPSLKKPYSRLLIVCHRVDRLWPEGLRKDGCRTLRSPHPVPGFYGNSCRHNFVPYDLPPKILVPPGFPSSAERLHLGSVNLLLTIVPTKNLGPSRAVPRALQTTTRPSRPLTLSPV